MYSASSSVAGEMEVIEQVAEPCGYPNQSIQGAAGGGRSDIVLKRGKWRFESGGRDWA